MAAKATNQRLIELTASGYKGVAHIDESGYGSCAGDLVVVAVYIPSDTILLPCVKDSKTITTAKARHKVYQQVLQTPGLQFAIVRKTPTEIDVQNVYHARFQAFGQAITELQKKVPIDYALIDGSVAGPHIGVPHKTVVKGDSSVYGISIAGIIAKCTRDQDMVGLQARYPMYAWTKHSGYVNPNHVLEMEKFGVIPGVHRQSYITCQGKPIHATKPYRSL